MLFYVVLFVACVIVSVAFLYLFKALENVGKDVYQAPVESIRARHARRAKEVELRKTVNTTPTPWGWNGAGKANRAVRTRRSASMARIPRGSTRVALTHNAAAKSGNSRFHHRRERTANHAQIVSADVGWPYRQEPFKLSGKDYRPVPMVKPEPADLSKTGKPWGW